MKKTSVKKDGAKATEKATYVSALKSSVPPPSAQKQKTAGKGGIGSQPKMKFNQKKLSLVSSASVATVKISGPPKLQVLEQKTRAKPSKTEHSKGLLTVSAKISPLKSSVGKLTENSITSSTSPTATAKS